VIAGKYGRTAYPVLLAKLIKNFPKFFKKALDISGKTNTIRILINNRSLLYSTEPEFVFLADLHGFEVKDPEIRILPHNPEVSGSNPLPATKREPETNNLRFFVSPEEFGYKIFFLGGFCNEPETVGFDYAIE